MLQDKKLFCYVIYWEVCVWILKLCSSNFTIAVAGHFIFRETKACHEESYFEYKRSLVWMCI
jgi:hypothetical protein